MTMSVSGPDSTLPAAALSTTSPHHAQKPAAPNDTVKLSESQQVQPLLQQGNSAAQIATSLFAAIVESYLGTQATAPTPNSAPAPPPPTRTISVSATAGSSKS